MAHTWTQAARTPEKRLDMKGSDDDRQSEALCYNLSEISRVKLGKRLIANDLLY